MRLCVPQQETADKSSRKRENVRRKKERERKRKWVLTMTKSSWEKKEILPGKNE